MATYCSTGFRRKILGPNSFESIFNGGQIKIYSGPQPANADAAVTGELLGTITAPGGLRFVRSDHYVTNDPAQQWMLQGSANGEAGWGRLVAPDPDAGGADLLLPRIDFAIGLDGDEPGDFQMLLPTLSLSPTTSIAMSAWWFMLPPF